MSKYDALEGLDDFLGTPKKKPKKPEPPPKKKAKPVVAEPEVRFPNNEVPGSNRQIVRAPRTVPAKAAKKIQKKKDEAARGIIFGPGALGEKRETQQRRELIVNWLLDGHTYEGETLSQTELAKVLNVPKETLEYDIAAIKERMSTFYEDKHNKEMPIMAYMLMEMKMQDRGRALNIHNLIMDDIDKADANVMTFKDPETGRSKTIGSLTGRDRAAMYSAALQAMDLAQKATNGLDNIFKMVGGPQRILAIIQAKALKATGGTGGHSMNTIGELQEAMASLPEFQALLPSTRKIKHLNPPTFITVTPEDQEIMNIGSRAREETRRKKQIPVSDAGEE